MEMLPNPNKRVNYIVCRDNKRAAVPALDGTSLGYFWNQIRSYYLPGQIVTIIDNYGNSQTFIRGVRG